MPIESREESIPSRQPDGPAGHAPCWSQSGADLNRTRARRAPVSARRLRAALCGLDYGYLMKTLTALALFLFCMALAIACSPKKASSGSSASNGEPVAEPAMDVSCDPGTAPAG